MITNLASDDVGEAAVEREPRLLLRLLLEGEASGRLPKAHRLAICNEAGSYLRLIDSCITVH